MEKQKTVKVIPVECYSRVCGFYRPVMQFNKGKQEEFRERVEYSVSKIKAGCK